MSLRSSLRLRNPGHGPRLAICALAIACGGSLRAQQLPVRAYGIENGLAGDSIAAIFQDSRDYLWIATTDGVSRFDGERFTNYGTREGLPDARVFAMLEDRGGRYWFATRGGLVRFVPDRAAGASSFVRLVLGTPRAEPVYSLFQDRAGRIWAGGESQLFLIEMRGGEWTAHEVGLAALQPPPGRIEAIAETADGSLWLGSQTGLLRRTAGGWLRLPVKPHHGDDTVHDLEVDEQGRLWIAHELHAFVLWPVPADRDKEDPRTILVDRVGRGLQITTAGGRLPQVPGEVAVLGTGGEAGWRQIRVAQDGVWLATARGLFVWDRKRSRLRVATEENGLRERSLTAVAKDRNGNIWVGTESRGLLRLARDGFLTFTAREGLAHPRITSLVEGRDGTLYVQSGDTFEEQLWLHRLTRSRLTAVRPRLPPQVTYLGWSVRQSAVLDQSNRWWLATGQGLLRYPEVARLEDLATARPRLFTVRDGLSGNSVVRLFEDRRGDLWIGTYGQRPLTVWTRATGAFHTYGPEDGLPAAMPSALAEDRAGQVWIGFADQGLVRFRSGRFERFGAADGLPSGSIQDLFVDRSGRLWVASEDGGAGRLDRPAAAVPRFARLTTRDGLSSNEVRCITEDAQGRIYLGGRKGIDRLGSATGRIEHFTTAEGLTSNMVDALLRARTGFIWAGTRNGLSLFDPVRDVVAPVPSPWITAVRIDGVPRPVSELGAFSVPEMELESGRDRLEVEFLAVSFVSGRGLRYQYRLEGADPGWSNATASRSVLYGHLPPGRFRFVVRTLAPDREERSRGVAELWLVVHPPLWRRAWFQGLVFLFLAGAATVLYRYRVAHLVAIERMRTGIATDLHDDLGSSLSRISILSEVARRRAAEDAESARLLTDIGETAREMMEALGESIWAIDPRRDDLRSLATRIRRFAGDLLEGRGIAWQLIAPPDGELVKLSPGERRQLYLVFKEALHNAARHSGASSVSLRLGLAGRRLTAEIRDDGRGFLVAADGESAGRHGLGSMRARAAALGGRLEIDSAPGRGTQLRLDVPLAGGGA